MLMSETIVGPLEVLLCDYNNAFSLTDAGERIASFSTSKCFHAPVRRFWGGLLLTPLFMPSVVHAFRLVNDHAKGPPAPCHNGYYSVPSSLSMYYCCSECKICVLKRVLIASYHCTPKSIIDGHGMLLNECQAILLSLVAI